MSQVTVSNSAGLTAALASAKAGDVIRLESGDYGDVLIRSKIFAQDVTITSLNADHPAVLNSLTVVNSSGINFDGVNVNFQPTADTTTSSSAVRFSGSSDISFAHATIKGGAAVTGVAANATTLDATGNVIGDSTGRGITIERGHHITVDGVDISKVFRGIVMSDATDVRIVNNNIHDLRTSAIVGGDVSHVVIDNNKLSDARPWHWGTGDHADFIHLWTVPGGQTGASTDIQITHNTISQGAGTAILGIYLDDNLNGLGFSKVTIAENVLLNGNAQGLRLENTFDSKVVNNTFLQTTGAAKDAPGVYLTDSTHAVDVSGNVLGYVSDAKGTDTGFIHDNTIVQSTNPMGGGYYSAGTATAIADGQHSTLADHNALVKMLARPAAPPAPLPAVEDLGGESMKLSAKSNVDALLLGRGGNDTITGLGGNDYISGGAGSDHLSGGGGTDTLVGGSGGDLFVFGKAYSTEGGIDVIVDFTRTQGDKLNLHSIDANSATAKDDDFRFIEQAKFHNIAGELRYETVGNDAIVQGDTNGDGIADFSIRLLGVKTLMATDFIF